VLETEFVDFQEILINYIDVGKLPSRMTKDKIIQTIDGLELSQKMMLKRRLEHERRSLLIVEPHSLPPAVIPFLTHGPDALKRACFVFCLTIAANALFSPVFSIGSALMRGVGLGCTMFGASVAYDNSQCTFAKKHERAMQMQGMLDKYHLESQEGQEAGETGIIFKISKIH
jgi:hypothetical protein